MSPLHRLKAVGHTLLRWLAWLWPTHSRIFDPHNVLDELARAIDDHVRGPEGRDGSGHLLAVLRQPHDDRALRQHVESPAFMDALHARLGAVLGPQAPAAVHLRLEAGEAGIAVHHHLTPPAPVLLSWGDAQHKSQDEVVLRVGRGPLRKRERGVPNDVVLGDAWGFVSHDAFTLRWSPASRHWTLQVSADARAAIRVIRHGRTILLQATSLALNDGDRIEVVGGTATLPFTFQTQEAA